nr:hypothetical protein [Nocardia abscessus]
MPEREAFGQADQLGKPVEDMLFQLGTGRTGLPEHPLHAQSGGQQIGQRRRTRRTRRVVGEETGMLPMRRAGQDNAIHIVEQVGKRLTQLRWR